MQRAFSVLIFSTGILLVLVVGLTLGWTCTLQKQGTQDMCAEFVRQEKAADQVWKDACESSCRWGSALQAEGSENLTFRRIEWGVEQAPKMTPACTCTLAGGNGYVQVW
jgi:hypothetical protein